MPPDPSRAKSRPTNPDRISFIAPMALRQGVRALARSVIGSKSLPIRGGGGGPVKFAEEVKKPVSSANHAAAAVWNAC